jgi:hypothetical protein
MSPWFLQVDIVQLKLLQTRLQRSLDVMHVRLIDFGGDEELFSGYTTLLDCSSELRLSL